MSLIDALTQALAGTVKRQLIWGVALVHAAMMTLFVVDLSQRQQQFLLDNQHQQAASLAQSLSLTAITPMLSGDYSGLQELTLATAHYPDVAHAMVLLADGKVVAHGQPELRGQYLRGFEQFSQATARGLQTLANSRTLADVAVPVEVNGERLGWVRVGVSQSATAQGLRAIVTDGLLYTLAAIAVGVLLAWWLASRLTRRLSALAGVADQVSAGQLGVRAQLSGRDELSHLARALNLMLDALAQQVTQEKQLRRDLQAEKELAQITLASIGDAVITTNAGGHIDFMNEVAQALTGWHLEDAHGRHAGEVIQTLDAVSQANRPNPVLQVLGSGVSVVANDHTLLVSRQQTRCPIESQATPIHGPDGELLGCVLVFRDVSERFLVQDRLQWQAGHDALTGLPNRALLADRFERAMDKARRESTQLAVCLLDLDNFKPVNDTHGHATGDALLVALAARLNHELRAVDTLSRLGGDEFVILLEDLNNADDLAALLQRVLDALARPFEIQGQRITITASLGYTVFPQDGADPDTLLRHADQAMYVAKQTGRNRYHRFDVDQDRERESAHQTVQRVLQAVVQDELRLHYQPKVNLSTGVVEGFEALLRWQHPQDGMIPPMAFLPILEQSDVIVTVGEWVIETALKQLRQWASRGRQWPVSVNIAARHFLHEDFLPRLNILLGSYPDVSPRLLEFEVLESASLGDVHTINAIIMACRDLGIGFSLDDFGTGYSSLSYLKRIPVQTLKIDQSFVRDMLDDRDDRALVQSIIHIASLFRLHVVAEGVETQDQGALLLRMGCDVVQGYGIARPMPAEETFEWATHYRLDRRWQQLSHELPYHPRPVPRPTSDFTPLQ